MTDPAANAGETRATLRAEASQRLRTAPEIAAGLEKLDVTLVLRRMVEELSTDESLTADPPISGYVGVRPSVNGTISVYVRRSMISLALEPHRARSAAERIGGLLEKRNDTTWFLRLGSEEVSEHRDYAVQLAREAVRKSEQGPVYEGGKEAARLAKAVRLICPACREYELSGVGNCMCGYGE